jgi:hypothetical protein
MNGIALSASSPVAVSVSVRMILSAYSLKLACLLKGHPDWGGVILLYRRGPKHQNIDAPIGNPVPAQGRVMRPAACSAFQGLPDAFLKFAYDLVGDLLMNVGFHPSLLVCRLHMQPALGERR